MSTEYRVVFSGKVRNEHQPKTVARKIAQALNRDEEFAETLLSGKPIVLKRTKNLNQANRIVSQLETIGAIASIDTISHKEELIPTHCAKEEGKLKRDSCQKPVFNGRQEHKDEIIPFRQRFQYRFDTFMAKGSVSSFKALLLLFVAIFLLVAGLRGLLYWLSPALNQQYESLDFLGNIYITFLQLTDPGNMAQDIMSSPGYKIFAVFAGLAGVILLSALIAIITTAMDQKLDELKRGRSKVIEKGHTLIIGWDEQRIIEILRELILANESEPDACVVILADMDKQVMDDTLRLRIPDSLSTRVVTRSGRGTILANLELVSVESAKSVIVLANCLDTDPESSKTASDALVIQTVLAVCTKSVRKEDYAIVAEVFNNTYRDIIEHTLPDFVVTLDTANILAKLLVQTSRSVGLSVVYNEILSFDGCEMYFYDAEWGGMLFGNLAFHFPDGVPIGIRHVNGELSINPPADYPMRDDDEILIVADDDSTIDFQKEPVARARSFTPLNKKASQSAEIELIVGYNHKTETILKEFSDYVENGSRIDIILHNASDTERAEIERINQEVDNIEITLLDINPLDQEALAALQPEKYGNIIILASARSDKDPQQVDSENIVTLLLLRSILQGIDTDGRETKLITEVLESQNHALIAEAGVKDMIISNRLVSMITAQISESKGIKDVYDDLFQEDGSEIYLKPMSLYFEKFPVQASFADLIRVAQGREEICFGVKIKSLEFDQYKNNGVELIPPKDKIFELGRDDCLVVVAEDER